MTARSCQLQQELHESHGVSLELLVFWLAILFDVTLVRFSAVPETERERENKNARCIPCVYIEAAAPAS
jgi:hypothetical protein